MADKQTDEAFFEKDDGPSTEEHLSNLKKETTELAAMIDMTIHSFGGGSPTKPMEYRPLQTESYQEDSSLVLMALPLVNHFSDTIKRKPLDYPQAEGSISYMSYSSYLPTGVDISAGGPSLYDNMPHGRMNFRGAFRLPFKSLVKGVALMNRLIIL
ncbi:hypothetical protein VTI74DRAFT_2178 [Chaetomium olivicolor]